jgi:outer membrane receptor protein involved in Fe transport
MTTEETTGKTVKMWDAINPASPVLLGEWLGGNGLAHNTHLMGDLAIISHYSYGISLVDISDPNAPAELDRYDTYPAHDDAAFVGCWGAFPFTNGGWVYASDIEGDLVLLHLDQPAASPEPEFTSALFEAFPNPTRAETTLRYRLTEDAEVRLGVYNALGQTVRELTNARAERGDHVVTWDGADADGRPVSTGAYFLKLEVAGERPFQVTRKVIRTR